MPINKNSTLDELNDQRVKWLEQYSPRILELLDIIVDQYSPIWKNIHGRQVPTWEITLRANCYVHLKKYFGHFDRSINDFQNHYFLEIFCDGHTVCNYTYYPYNQNAQRDFDQSQNFIVPYSNWYSCVIDFCSRMRKQTNDAHEQSQENERQTWVKKLLIDN